MSSEIAAQTPKWLRWLFVAAIGFSAATVFFDVWYGLLLARQSRTAGFPHVVGRILKSEVRETQGTKPTYAAEVEFAWRVAGVEYKGATVRHGFSRSGKVYVERVVARYPVGREVEVYYDPAAPGEAVLEPGLVGGDLNVLIFATPFHAITLGLWTIAWPMWRYQATGGVPVRQQGSVQRLETEQMRPVHWALIAAGALGLALSLVLAIFTDGSASWTAGLGMLAAIIGAGAAGWIVRAVMAPKETRELVVDWENDRLIVPALDGRESPLTVPLSSVAKFAIARVGAEGSESQRFYAVAAVNEADGSTSVHRLGDEQLEWGAWNLACWLQEGLLLRRG